MRSKELSKELALVAWLINLRSTKNLRKVDSIKQFRAYSNEYTSVKERDSDFNEAIEKKLIKVDVEDSTFLTNYVYSPTEKGIKELEEALNIKIEV